MTELQQAKTLFQKMAKLNPSVAVDIHVFNSSTYITVVFPSQTCTMLYVFNNTTGELIDAI